MCTHKFHRNALEIPADPQSRQELLKWLMAHPVWQHEYLIQIPPEGQSWGFTMEPQPEWEWRDVRDGSMLECVEFCPVFVNPDTMSIDDDDTKNTLFRVWVEAGPWYDMSIEEQAPAPEGGWTKHNKWIQSHDLRLDCSGSDMQEAMLELALRVKYHYGDGDTHLAGVVHDYCQGVFDEHEKWHSTCRVDVLGYCTECGYAV